MSAARTVSGVYGDVERCWRQPERRAAVDAVRALFARTGDAALDGWRRFPRAQVAAAPAGPPRDPLPSLSPA